MTLRPATDDLRAYLAADEIVDWYAPAVLATADRVTSGAASRLESARRLFEWVRDAVPHTNDAGREEVTCSASEVLETGTGICYAKAHLLAALLRAVDVPAGFCYQVYEEPLHASEDKTALHGLNGVYIESLGRWVRLDARGNTGGVSAEFSTAEERLAFPELAFLDDLVYPAPLPGVVEALRRWPTRAALWPNLPKPEPTPTPTPPALSAAR